MPSSSMKRKLLCANKALKGLTTLLRSKFLLLRRSKAFKRTATGLGAAISTVLARRRRRRRRLRLKSRRSLPRLPSEPGGRHRKRVQRHQQGDFPPAYVDDVLFFGPATTVEVVQAAVVVDGNVQADEAEAAPDAGVAVAAGLGMMGMAEPITGGEGGGGGSLASSAVGFQHLQGVDLRAELFIAKFREEMRRQT